ncbi:MAG: hypothetical protein F6J92_22630 [Symploca sp. SIO1A3]|nr:hypothetical protein [Symploca sp. SIO1A3]
MEVKPSLSTKYSYLCTLVGTLEEYLDPQQYSVAADSSIIEISPEGLQLLRDLVDDWQDLENQCEVYGISITEAPVDVNLDPLFNELLPILHQL